MQAQWQPNPSGVSDYDGPSFRRGGYLAASRKGERELLWHVFRIRDNDSVEQLPGEFTQPWNAAESVEFPRDWADQTIAEAGGEKSA